MFAVIERLLARSAAVDNSFESIQRRGDIMINPCLLDDPCPSSTSLEVSIGLAHSSLFDMGWKPGNNSFKKNCLSLSLILPESFACL
jgi:hypothetical protein